MADVRVTPAAVPSAPVAKLPNPQPEPEPSPSPTPTPSSVMGVLQPPKPKLPRRCASAHCSKPPETQHALARPPSSDSSSFPLEEPPLREAHPTQAPPLGAAHAGPSTLLDPPAEPPAEPPAARAVAAARAAAHPARAAARAAAAAEQRRERRDRARAQGAVRRRRV